ncbi:MAG: hypothetical protein Q8O32_02430 [bacterium]|nr:hypothetical protein [bacterium]
MLHLWSVPDVQTNILFRQNLWRSEIVKKCEFGAGPGFAMVNDHEAWAYLNFELDSKIQLGPLIWSGYQLGQWSRQDKLRDSALLREQLFYQGFPLGIVGNNQFSNSQKPHWFWGLIYSFGQTGPFGTNKFLLTANMANIDEVWAAWIIEI